MQAVTQQTINIRNSWEGKNAVVVEGGGGGGDASSNTLETTKYS